MANRSTRFWLRLCLLLAAAASSPLLAQPDPDPRSAAQLNSERIEQRFGSYGIEVLSSDDALRVANLYSTEVDHGVCRTFAVTRFPDPVAAAYATIAEVHHADYLALGDLIVIFGDDWREGLDAEAAASMLALTLQAMQ